MDTLIACYRFVFNQCLARIIDSYTNKGKRENWSSLGRFFYDELLKDDSNGILREQNKKVLVQAIMDVLDAYKRFFNQKGCRSPKFKSKYENRKSCRFECGAISRRNNYLSYRISLANIRNIRFRCSKQYAEYLQENKGDIKHATLVKNPSGQYHLSVLVDGPLMRNAPYAKGAVGIDIGIKNFVVTSDGEVFHNPHFEKSQQTRIKRMCRRLSKKQLDGKNRGKARRRLAKEHQKIYNRKQHYLHHVSNSLIDGNQVICMEDLNVRGLMRNHSIAVSLKELNFRNFRNMLEYKSLWYGRKFVLIDRFYPSSKTCSHCGYVNQDITLKNREWECPKCGELIDRDYNAAVNILDEGMKQIGDSIAEFKPVETPTVDDRTLCS